MMHPDERISQLRFIGSLVREYIQNKRSTRLKLPDIPRLVPLSANNHFIVSFNQGRCKICKKNATKSCKECNIRLHEQCFPAHHK